MKMLSSLANDWPALSRLLDEALALPAEQRARWLDSLDTPSAPLRDTLQRLLAMHAGAEAGDFLDTLPPLPVAPLGGAGAAPLAGDSVGPWHLLAPLGEGGMGSVWLAERTDGALKRQVALKLPLVSWASGLAERMARERDILATLEHPHIARLYDAGVDQLGRPWLALEYVMGRPIDLHCREAALPVRARIELLLQVCQAVAYAHSRLVIHRDLKPSNVLVTADGQAKLLDFGIAKLMQGGANAEATALTRSTGRALTLDYASPEQVRGEALSTASDVYSLGVLAYELLAGHKPYKLERGSAAELEEAIARADVPLASRTATDEVARRALRGDLDAVLNRALKKDSAERYPTIAALADDLRRHLAGDSVAARPDSLPYRARRLLRRYRIPLATAAVVSAAFGLALGVGATALVVGALLMGLAAALWQAQRARQQADEARRLSAQAQAVQGFLLDIFRSNTDRQDDPKAGRALTARELLDRGAARVETALAGDTAGRAEVLHTLGEMYYQLGHDEQAADLYRRRVVLLRQLHDPQDRRLAVALVDLAAALHGTRWRDEILPALQEAEQILDALGETGSALRGDLLTHLAQRYQNLSLPRMLAHAEAALRVLRALPPHETGGLSTTLHLAARAHLLNGNLVRADRLFDEALQALLREQPLPHLSVLQTLAARGDALMQQGRHRDALACLAQACDDARSALGEDDVNWAWCASRQANALHALGRRTEARTLHRAALDKIVALKGADDTLFTPSARINLCRDLYVEGRFEEARALAAMVAATNRRHYAGSVVLAGTLRTEALVSAACGDTSAARGLLAEAGQHWAQAMGDSATDWRANRNHLSHARVALAAGEAGAALASLRQIVPPPPEATPLPGELAEAAVLHARAHSMAGDCTAALAAAQTAWQLIEQSALAVESPALSAEAGTALAMALCNSDLAAEALDMAQAAVRWRIEHDAPESPWAAEAEAVEAACRASLGQTVEAVALRQRAADRLAAHPQLSPLFGRALPT